RMPVVRRNFGELTTGAQLINDCAGDEDARICRPTVILVETDFLRRGSVNNGPLPQINRRLEFSYGYRRPRALRGHWVRRGRHIQRVVLGISDPTAASQSG